MTEVLIVDDDTQFGYLLTVELQARGYQAEHAHNVIDALGHLDRRAIDVLVTDLRMDGHSGMELLRHVGEHHPNTRAILMSGQASARDYESAVAAGAVRVLCKPFTPELLVEAVQHALDCGQGFRGSVHGLSLADVLQMFHYGQRSIAINIEGSNPGRIEMIDGEVVHASQGDASGADALKQILAEASGAIRTLPLSAPSAQTVALPFQMLLLDVVRVLDEERAAQAEQGRAAGDDEAMLIPTGLLSWIPSNYPSLAGEQGPAESPQGWRWIYRQMADDLPDGRAALVDPDGTVHPIYGNFEQIGSACAFYAHLRSCVNTIGSEGCLDTTVFTTETGIGLLSSGAAQHDVLVVAPTTQTHSRATFLKVMGRLRDGLLRAEAASAKGARQP